MIVTIILFALLAILSMFTGGYASKAERLITLNHKEFLRSLNVGCYTKIPGYTKYFSNAAKYDSSIEFNGQFYSYAQMFSNIEIMETLNDPEVLHLCILLRRLKPITYTLVLAMVISIFTW